MTPTPPPVLGVTGSVAAGKSTLSRALAELGARVVDADALGHRALATPDVRAAVAREFGADVLAPDGSLDRRALARAAFEGDAPRRRLEAVVHPLVRRWIDEAVRRARDEGAPLVVIDCALLFESGLDGACDATVAVDAPRALRVRRARTVHGWDEEELGRREAAQLPAAEKRARADRVLENDADPERLRHEAKALFDAVVRRAPAAADARRSTR